MGDFTVIFCLVLLLGEMVNAGIMMPRNTKVYYYHFATNVSIFTHEIIFMHSYVHCPAGIVLPSQGMP